MGIQGYDNPKVKDLMQLPLEELIGYLMTSNYNEEPLRSGRQERKT